MQSAFRNHWRYMARRTHKPRRLGNFGFFNPWRWVIEACQSVVLSNFQSWPEPGGWNSQTEAFRHDFKIYMQGLANAQWKVDRKERAKQRAQTGAKEPENQPIPSWSEYG